MPVHDVQNTVYFLCRYFYFTWCHFSYSIYTSPTIYLFLHFKVNFQVISRLKKSLPMLLSNFSELKLQPMLNIFHNFQSFEQLPFCLNSDRLFYSESSLPVFCLYWCKNASVFIKCITKFSAVTQITLLFRWKYLSIV